MKNDFVLLQSKKSIRESTARQKLIDIENFWFQLSPEKR